MLSASSSTLAAERPQGPLLVQMGRFRNVASQGFAREPCTIYMHVGMLDPRGEAAETAKRDTVPRSKPPSASLHFQITFIYAK